MYLVAIKEFLESCDASIITNKRHTSLRICDSFIMFHVLRSDMCRRKVNMVNKVRFYLHVETVAEISNPEGTKLDQAWMR